MSLADVRNRNQLRRWLTSRVSQNWGSVYSEITIEAQRRRVPYQNRERNRTDFRGGYYRGFDLLDETGWLVEENAYRRESDGVWVYVGRFDAEREVGPDNFYVDTQDRLQRTRPKPPNLRQKQKNVVEKEGRTFARHDNGVWYEIWARTDGASVTGHSTIRDQTLETVPSTEVFLRRSSRHPWSRSRSSAIV